MNTRRHARTTERVAGVVLGLCCLLSYPCDGEEAGAGRPATRDDWLTIEKQDQEFTITIGEGEVIYVQREGMVAKDRNGNLWRSRRVNSASDAKIAFFLVADQAPEAAASGVASREVRRTAYPEDRYRWETKWKSAYAANGITVKDTKVLEDGRREQGLSGSVPIVRNQIVLDAPGSRNVTVEVDPAVKETWYAGLFFNEPCVLQILEDFTLLADKEGLRVRDKHNNHWITQKVLVDDQQVIAFLPEQPQQPASSPTVPNESPTALLPPFTERLEGGREVRVRNPNAFVVYAGIRKDNAGVNFEVSANGAKSAFVPDGKYEIYFVYSSKPDALFKGDDFTLAGHGVEIKIVKVVGGNYGIRQVK